jgi:hypothetical protein
MDQGPKYQTLNYFTTERSSKHSGTNRYRQRLLSRTPVAQQLRDRMNKWDFIKLKSFCTTKEMVCKLKRPPTEWKKIFASYTSDKGLITRTYRELKKLNFPKNQ